MLTSYGFITKKLFNEFVKLVGKPVVNIKIVFVPTAAILKTDYDPTIVPKELIAFGIKTANIKILEINKKVIDTEFEGFDALIVGGGNTFLLLDYARKNGFIQVAKEFVKNHGVYVGISAGSILAAPDIKLARITDANKVNINDLNGLNLIDFAVAPHVGNPEFIELGVTLESIKSFNKTVPYNIIPLTDEQAVVVIDGKRRIVG